MELIRYLTTLVNSLVELIWNLIHPTSVTMSYFKNLVYGFCFQSGL